MRPSYTAWLACATLMAAGAALTAARADAVTIVQIGQYVERYYARAQSVVSQETITLRPLPYAGYDLRRPRRLVYELRVDWNPAAAGDGSPATVVRDLVRVDGRAPKPGDEPGCMDPKPVSPEPLAMLLPDQRHEYAFTPAGTSRIDGRPSVMVDFRALHPGEPEVVWRDECVSVELPGRTRGRIWADAETAEILKFEERLVGRFSIPVPPRQRRLSSADAMIIEESATTIRYKRVAFRDPDETLMLPASIETLTVIRNSDIPRLLTLQSFDNYRRFITDARVVD